MSTHAAVFYKNDDGTFTGTEICADGYIEVVNPRRLAHPHSFGAGWFLARYWNNPNEIKKLAYGKAVRNLGQDNADTEFYNWRQNGLSNLSFDEVKNAGYSYVYIYNKKNGSWGVIKPDAEQHKGIVLSLDCFLDYEDPERFFDHDDFWY